MGTRFGDEGAAAEGRPAPATPAFRPAPSGIGADGPLRARALASTLGGDPAIVSAFVEQLGGIYEELSMTDLLGVRTKG